MNLAFAAIEEVAPAIARGEMSPVELTRAVLRQIETLEGRLNCYITVLSDAALVEATQAEAEIRSGRYRGPLHGIPVAIKDNLETAGIRSTAGSKILADYLPAEDAPVVARLRAAGAIIVGKTNLHEFGMGATSVNPHYGASRNPWNPNLITGGSSGGSAAAVAAGMALAALGTDAGGSVRIPAALCGVVGLKATHGLVPIRGCLGASNPTVDHIGPLTRSVGDALLVLRAIAGPDPRDPTTEGVPRLPNDLDLGGGIAGLRVGIPTMHYFDGLAAEHETLVRASIAELGRLGATLVDVSVPDHAVLLDGVAGLNSERLAYHGHWMRTRLPDYSLDVQASLLAAQLIPAGDYATALRVRRLLAERYASVLRQVDVLAMPTVVTPAYPVADAEMPTADSLLKENPPLARNTRLANLTGLPAISLPAGFTESGLPVGLMLMGRAFAEGTVLRTASAFEAATNWHRRRPPIAGQAGDSGESG